MTRQVEDHETGFQYGIGLDPEVKSLVGNQNVPYIYEDFISHETLAKAFMKMYEMGPEVREQLGQKALEHAHRDYNIDDVVSKWDSTLENCMKNWKSTHKRWEIVEV